jgi:hypothetical protein
MISSARSSLRRRRAMFALRAPTVTASEEETKDPFIELFSDEVMCMSYLYSKLPETGVPHHIGTEGLRGDSKTPRVSLDRRTNGVIGIAFCPPQ